MNWISLLTSCFLLISLAGCSGQIENLREAYQDTESRDEEKVVEENEGEQSTSVETNQTVKDQFDIISKQLVADGYAPLDDWHVEEYREELIGYDGNYQSTFIGETATLSILDDAEKITCVTVAVPSDEVDAYEKLCSVFSACTWNIFFTKDELKQIHDQLENAPTNTDIYINEHSLNYSEGIDILILGGG